MRVQTVTVKKRAATDLTAPGVVVSSRDPSRCYLMLVEVGLIAVSDKARIGSDISLISQRHERIDAGDTF